MKAPAVYILASQRNGTLYIGVTSNLIQRIWQHREGAVEGFTQQHAVKTLVWYEQHETMESAITREKALKKWNRDWKLRLIKQRNPEWIDLWSEITGQEQDVPHNRHSREGGNPVPIEAANLNNPSRHQTPLSPSASSSPNVLVGDGDPVQTNVQSTQTKVSATQNEPTGFPPKARGNDGNAGGGL
jgi:putative endonuclease